MVILTEGGGGGARVYFSTKWLKKNQDKNFLSSKNGCMECMELNETNKFTAQSHFVSCGLDSTE